MCIRDSFHGCVGEDFSDATPDGLQAMADYELSQGVTYICPAGMTLPEDQLRRICENAAAVSYTHLDVYKRQLVADALSEKHV